MRLLITGGCGFLGSNLAAHALDKGYELAIFDNLSRAGATLNLEWLKSKGKFHFFASDIRSFNDVERAVKEFSPDAVFHLAGQVAMTTSIENPRKDFEINALGSFNVLEAVRTHSPKAQIAYSSTNKVYGDLGDIAFVEEPTRYRAKDFPGGFDESLRLHFESPYGCSKGSADQYMLDYSKIFGLNTVVFRHSSIFGGRQFSTFDQGWVGWFVQKALEAKSAKKQDGFTISGDGKQVRDVLFASDLVNLYFSVLSQPTPLKGEVFNIGGGIENSLSLLELFSYLEESLNVKLQYTKLPWRASDQRVFVANISKAKEILGWSPQVTAHQGLDAMIEWQKSQLDLQK
ncbi:MAG: CDP-paratose 2-epimerase [Bdellovibrionales bacterium CG10_big_fil_rev_8_21_14_0_10_45_34]|nr:MAG: CDP-paratose 2-epimerase [Bdellovibrionales bacterium CG10_big_fil_rev_8_21_14_0_10_45_34]